MRAYLINMKQAVNKQDYDVHNSRQSIIGDMLRCLGEEVGYSVILVRDQICCGGGRMAYNSSFVRVGTMKSCLTISSYHLSGIARP
ncbi:MAG: hypothetical protein JWO03_3759 [Bacteroidetes bacterium]|nr:hypothetical protein [Bacteroidota bacterium]